jgi:radical SAM superfamily enzyme YgiQ (UPF0313 family)
MHNKRKIVLINTNNIFNLRIYNNDPINGSIQSTLLERGFDVVSLYNHSCDSICQKIEKWQPGYLGVNVKIPVKLTLLRSLFSIIKVAVQDIKIIAYGEYITTSYKFLIKENMNKYIDHFLLGEAEFGFLDIIEGFIASDAEVIQGKEITQLSDLPSVNCSASYELNTRISRGCVFNCLFCEEKNIYKKFRVRNVEDVVTEIRAFANRKTKDDLWVYFSDLDFLAIDDFYPTWLPNFFDQIQKQEIHFRFAIQTRVDRIQKDLVSELKKNGLANVALGVETNSKRISKIYRKGIKSLQQNIDAVQILQECHIPYKINFIMFEPTTTLDDLRSNLEYFEMIRFPAGAVLEHPPISFYNKLKIYPQSEAYQYYEKVKGIQLKINDGLVEYKFLYPEITSVYEGILMWRKFVKEYLLKYYSLLNAIVKNTYDPKYLLKISYINRIFLKVDFAYFTEMIDSLDTSNEKVMERFEDAIFDLTEKLNRIIMMGGQVKDDIESMDYRIWHGQLARLFDVEDC